MRIPLDYYKILGVPITATEGQISQSYHDRALQLPRREYSDAAIEARKQLLDEAYEVLSDPQRRSEYTAQLQKQADEPSQQVDLPLRGNETDIGDNNRILWLDIPRELFVGALLILQELGEYERVVKLGEPYLDNRNSISVDKGIFGDSELVRADIVLTLAFACMELGREQWQQGQYENAAVSGEIGQRLLLKENLFPSVRGEIQSDLYKLRPYRVLELLALPETETEERQKGLQLLQEMLQERGGIDGAGDDQSGLSVDDFLRFIQQLRSYLSAKEQQELFEIESRRPSAVATYLAVYALLGRGFAQYQPEFILRAKEMLVRLGRRQDVHLEQAVCSLLLGQTEAASRALEMSHEYEPLAFIREHSQDSPDLLPGLCLYAERWLQKEVFPHFRDLANQNALLKEYFADERVQKYLEQLPVEDTEASSSHEWAVVDPPQLQETSVARPQERNSYSLANQGNNGIQESVQTYASDWSMSNFTVQSPPGNGTATVERGHASGNTALPPVARRGASSEEGSRDSLKTVTKPSRRQRRIKQKLATAPLGEPIAGSSRLKSKSNIFDSIDPKKLRMLLLGIAGVVGLLLLLWLLFAVVRGIFASSPDPDQPLVELNQPPVEIPEVPQEAAEGVLNQAQAQETLQSWLDIKAQALGPDHEVDQLNNILVNPVLDKWRRSAIATQNNNNYWEYEHNLEIQSVNSSEENPNRATVEAVVSEDAQFYQGGQLNQAASYKDNLRVRYELVRQEDGWRIQSWQVL